MIFLLFQAKIFKLLLNEMVSVDVLETSEDYDDEDDEDESDGDDDIVDQNSFDGKSASQTIELSKMLDATTTKNGFNDVDDDDNDFEDPDARYVVANVFNVTNKCNYDLYISLNQ